MRNAEALIQAAVVAFVRQVAPDVLIFAVPNGGLRSKREAALLKWTGVLAGIPDLILILPDGRCAAWEVKTDVGRLTLQQSDMIWRLRKMGVTCHIIRSVDNARESLDVLGIVTCEARAA